MPIYLIEYEVDIQPINIQIEHLALELGIDRLKTHIFLSAVSEIGVNAIRYANGAEVQISKTTNHRGIEVIIQDYGPGIKDLEYYTQDGHSTSISSLGVGLGAAKRGSDRLIIKTSSEGTTITLEMYAPADPQLFQYDELSLGPDNSYSNNIYSFSKDIYGNQLFSGALWLKEENSLLIPYVLNIKEICLINAYKPINYIEQKIQDYIVEQQLQIHLEYHLMKCSQHSIDYVNKSSFSLSVFQENNSSYLELTAKQATIKLHPNFLLLLYNQGISPKFKGDLDNFLLKNPPYLIIEEIMKKYSNPKQHSSILAYSIKTPYE